MRRLAIVAALAFAACSTGPAAGPSGSPVSLPIVEPTPSPTPKITADELAAAAERTVETGTARLAFDATFEGSKLLRNGVGIKATGQASFGATPQTALDLDLTAAGLGAVDMILDDRLMYLRGQAFEQLTGRKRWLLIDLDSKHPVAAEFGSIGAGQNDSSQAIYYLHGVEGPIRFLGAEKIDGVVTARYGALVDLETALDRVPQRARIALEANIDDMLGMGIKPILDAQAWVGRDGLVHRVRYEYTLPPAMGGGKMIGVVGLSDFGAPLELNLPRPSEVVRFEDAVPPS